MRLRTSAKDLLAAAVVAALIIAPSAVSAEEATGEAVAPEMAADSSHLILRFLQRDPGKFQDKAAGDLLRRFQGEVDKARRAAPEETARKDAASAQADARVAAVLDPLRRALAGGEAQKALDDLWYLARGKAVPAEASEEKLPAEPPPEKPAERAEETKEGDPPADPEAEIRAEADRLFDVRLKARAMVLTGDLHMAGKGVVRNQSLARQWYLLAAKAGDAEAGFKLGHQYESGLGVPNSPTRASEWYEAAAVGGHGPAMIRLAGMLATGRGVFLNRMKAQAWVDRAVVTGEAVPAYLSQALDGEPAGEIEPEAATPEEMGEQLGQAMEVMAEGMGKGLEKMARAMVEGMAKGMQASLHGGTPAAFTPIHPPPGARDLVDRYVMAVGNHDLDGLKALFHSGSMACVTDETRADYDAGLTRAFANPPVRSADYPIKMAAIAAEGAVPFGAFLDYRVRPTHQLEVDLEAADGGTAPLVTPLIQADGGWAMVFPCLRGKGGAVPASAAPPEPVDVEPIEDRQAFIDALLFRIQAKDTAGLRAMYHPEVRACLTPETEPWFAFVDTSLFAIDFAGGTEVETSEIEAEEKLDGTYPVRPSHRVKITHDIRETADGAGRSSQSVTLEMVEADGAWYRAPLCPGPKEMAMLPFAKALLEGLDAVAKEMGTGTGESR